MERRIKIFPTAFILAESLANVIVNKITTAGRKKSFFSIALSGGKTPGILFSILGDHFSAAADWRLVHFFWVDERCVPPGDHDSNYGMAKAAIFDKISIPDSNIHRIRGEEDPNTEVLRYARELNKIAGKKNGLPVFDITILGMGEDGHVASIFPGNEFLFFSDELCSVAEHPSSGQKRITLSGKLINNSRDIYFMVTGKNKATIVNEILGEESTVKRYPSSLVAGNAGKTYWYIDMEAAALLGNKIQSY